MEYFGDEEVIKDSDNELVLESELLCKFGELDLEQKRSLLEFIEKL
jgi:hypothetical protein